MENSRGIIYMTLAMAGFALEDLLIKVLSNLMPISQILIFIGIVAGLLFYMIAKVNNTDVFTKEMFESKTIRIRTIADMFGAVFIVSALSMVPLSTVSSILQATPILVTLGAALIFKEQVGWRRWAAVFVGLIGVILILKPGMNSFQVPSLFALIGVLFLALRDLVTRKVKSNVPSLTVSIYAFAGAAAGGILTIPFTSSFVMLTTSQWLLLLAATLVGCFSYLTLVLATRAGEISAIAPFRYTRLIFALLLSVFILKERPDLYTITGACIIILSGYYTFWRENIPKM